MTLEVALPLIVIVAALAAALGFLIARKKSGDQPEYIDKISEKLDALDTRVTDLTDTGRKSQGELTKAVEDRLDKVSVRMGKSLEESSSKPPSLSVKLKLNSRPLPKCRSLCLARSVGFKIF